MIRFVSVVENGEWGSFFLRSGVSERPGAELQYWCELSCNTSFGSVGHFWSHMGRPAAEFLSNLDKQYVLEKLWGTEAEVFDVDKALVDARDLILRERRAGEITQEQARDRWEELKHECLGGEADFIGFVHRCDWLLRHLSEGEGPFGMVPNPQAEGFWATLWPGFVRQLTDPSLAGPEAGTDLLPLPEKLMEELDDFRHASKIRIEEAKAIHNAIYQYARANATRTAAAKNAEITDLLSKNRALMAELNKAELSNEELREQAGTLPAEMARRVEGFADRAEELEARAERMAEALHTLEEACGESDSAQYGTLGTAFVRGICQDARGEAYERGRETAQRTPGTETAGKEGFEAWMDRDWPLWRNDPDSPMVSRLRRAWQAAQDSTTGDAR